MKCIVSIRNVEECSDFFEDLCTVAEIKAMAQRLHVARMLREHHIYSDIVAKTGASTATISRVNRSLNYGSEGYAEVLDRQEKP
jgi:TrpR-related protein YerC/YecD